MKQVTLQPGDYVATEGMTEEQYYPVAQAFMNAGAKRGEYPSRCYFHTYDCMGWVKGNSSVWHQDSAFFETMSGRQLTIEQVLNATNAGGKEIDMHITDKLNQARKERDEAQARYEQALAKHREAYPWLLIDDKSEQATDDMTDPANWRAGDWLLCKRDACDLTGNKIYKVLLMDGGNDPVIDDDADKSIARPAYHFRFHSRPK